MKRIKFKLLNYKDLKKPIFIKKIHYSLKVNNTNTKNKTLIKNKLNKVKAHNRKSLKSTIKQRENNSSLEKIKKMLKKIKLTKMTKRMIQMTKMTKMKKIMLIVATK